MPQYEGLKVENLLAYANTYPEIKDFLPVEKEVKKLTRAYVCNVIYTVVGEPFQLWVKTRVDQRHERIKEG